MLGSPLGEKPKLVQTLSFTLRWGERIRFLFGKIQGSKATALGTGLRDIRSPNQYKIFVHCEEKQRAINNESSNE